MKKIFFILLITTCISCNKKEKIRKIIKNDLEKRDLAENTNILEEKSFDATEKFGEVVKLKLVDWEIQTFDTLGNLIEKKSMYEDGKICSIETYKYNSQNKIIEENFICGNIQHLGKYKYDNNGNNIDLTYFSNNKISVKHIKKFDSNNNLIDYRLYQSDGILDHKTLSKFNDDNLEIEKEEYSFNGISCVFTSKKTMQYNENGNLIEEKNYDKNGNLEFYYKYDYDEKQNEIEKIYSKNNIITTNKRNLDKFGNCIEGIEYKNDNQVRKFSNIFDYDKKGNWNKRIHSNDEIVNNVVERKIKYYN